MKEKIKNFPLLIILLLCVRYGFSSPLETGSDGFGNPFLLYFNPSLICRQTGGPIGTSFYYGSSSKRYTLSTGFIETFKRSGFSLCYVRKNHDYYNNISTAFSSLYKNISFGATFHFIFSGSEPLFTLDAGGSYHFTDSRYVGIVFKNFFDVDTSNEILSREMRIATGGDIPRINRMYYTIQGIATLYNFKQREFGGGGDVNIHKYFFENPSLSLYSRGKALYNREKEIEWTVEAAAGYHHFFQRVAFGVYAGYEYPSDIKTSRISLSLYFNPQYQKNIPKLSCTIKLTSPEITPDGDGVNDKVIIDIDGVFSNKEVRTKRWTLLVKKDLTSKDNILRTFSGGDIPPSSILWEGRDTNGQLVDDGTYYIQLFIIDTINRVVSSSTEKIIMK